MDVRGRSTDICVKLSLGKVFQELKLVYPNIHVTIYRQKVQYNPRPFEYSYNLYKSWPMLQLSPTPTQGEPPLLGMHVTFSYKRTEHYNWNYLDHHVCGHSDFEVLQEVRLMDSNHIVVVVVVVVAADDVTVICFCTSLLYFYEER